MIQVYLFLLAGLVLLFISGKLLVDSSVAIARLLKIPTMVIGLTVVAFGTSAPELLVSLQAASRGYPEIAMGNVVGSNISNILLVLAITAVIFPIPVSRRSVLLDWPAVMGVSLLLLVLSLDGGLSRTEGVILVTLLTAYLGLAVWQTRRGHADPVTGLPVKPAMKGWVAGTVLVASCGGLALGAHLLVENAARIASGLGISQRVISITMVAVGTSIPELATSVIAALKKETDISLGNILGSNIMNILTVLGFTSLVSPVQVDPQISRFDIPWMAGVTFLLLFLILPASRARITRWEGLLMIVVYLLYIYLIF